MFAQLGISTGCLSSCELHRTLALFIHGWTITLQYSSSWMLERFLEDERRVNGGAVHCNSSSHSASAGEAPCWSEALERCLRGAGGWWLELFLLLPWVNLFYAKRMFLTHRQITYSFHCLLSSFFSTDSGSSSSPQGKDIPCPHVVIPFSSDHHCAAGHQGTLPRHSFLLEPLKPHIQSLSEFLKVLHHVPLDSVFIYITRAVVCTLIISDLH